MKKPTYADRVCAVIKRDGYITNFYALNEMRILRLAAIVHQLRSDGRITIDETASGFISKTKNYRYVAKVLEAGAAKPVAETSKPEQVQSFPKKPCDCKFCHNLKGKKTVSESINCIICGCFSRIGHSG